MLRAYLELLRPANVATAASDVLAGFGVAGLAAWPALPWLLGSTMCLYAGGIVLNDVFDRDLDRVERPERPLPSGRVAARDAALLGGGLLAAGVALAFTATQTAGLVAIAIAAVVLLYDAWGKRRAPIAALNMGLCRALNLLLGVAAVPAALAQSWTIAAIPLMYIFAITTLSRGEVHGGRRGPAIVALIALAATCTTLLALGASSGPNRLAAFVLAAAVAFRVGPSFWTALQTPTPTAIRSAVKRGVLSLVILDAAIGAAYAGPVYAAVILATGLVAGWLARLFAVT